MHVRTAHALDQLAQTQKGGILIIAAQFGKRHGNPIARSVRRAREVFKVNEFGLGSVAVGAMVLSHPGRYICWQQLHTDFPGDEFAPDADGGFSYAPYFYFSDGKLEFYTNSVGYPSGHYGSASAFAPQ